jgi:hypothetical protein
MVVTSLSFFIYEKWKNPKIGRGSKERETRWRTLRARTLQDKKNKKNQQDVKAHCYLTLTSNCPESTNVSKGVPFKDMEQGSRKLYQLSSGDKDVRMPLEGERN